MSRSLLWAAVYGLAIGLLVHAVTVYARDFGPSGDEWSLRGNGAIPFLGLGMVALLVGEFVYVRRRDWGPALVFPLALFLGLFVVAGPI